MFCIQYVSVIFGVIIQISVANVLSFATRFNESSIGVADIEILWRYVTIFVGK